MVENDTKHKASTAEELEASIFADDPVSSEAQINPVAHPVLVGCKLSETPEETLLKILSKGCRLVNVKDVPRVPGYQWLTESTLRHMIFQATQRYDAKGSKLPTNGLHECGALIYIGQDKNRRQRILVDLDGLDRWIDQCRTSQGV
ncbi:MAG TPA: hypothetical protein VHP34_01030 [Alphaproteobacteria bacterium]|nr:hypothetical protein [Alphaproteobacteria bacterium]